MLSEDLRVSKGLRASDRAASWPTGRLLWIRGFDAKASGTNNLEAIYEPAIRCFSKEQPKVGRLTATELRRSGGTLITRSHSISQLNQLSLDSFFFFDQKAPKAVPFADDSKYGESQRRAHESVVIDLSNCDSDIIFLGREGTPPDVSAVACDFGAPIVDLGLWVARDDYYTIIIPCSEILKSCYLPSAEHLVSFLSSGGTGGYARDGVFFNGYKYCTWQSSVWFPMRAQRNFKKAEFEVSQLLPRAAAHGMLHGTFPFIIAPPINGQVQIRGRVLKRSRRGGRTTLLFLYAHFGSPGGDWLELKSAPTRWEMRGRLRFSPTLEGRGFCLPSIHAYAERDDNCPHLAEWNRVFPAKGRLVPGHERAGIYPDLGLAEVRPGRP